MRRMVSASNSATLTWRILLQAASMDKGNGVGNHQFVQRRAVQIVHRRTRQHRVGAVRGHLGGTATFNAAAAAHKVPAVSTMSSTSSFRLRYMPQKVCCMPHILCNSADCIYPHDRSANHEKNCTIASCNIVFGVALSTSIKRFFVFLLLLYYYILHTLSEYSLTRILVHNTVSKSAEPPM